METHLNSIREMLEKLDFSDASSEILFEQLEKIRAKNKLVSSLLGVKPMSQKEENSF